MINHQNILTQPISANIHQDIDMDDDVLLADPETQIQPPRLYAVVMYNDDYTTMDFVVEMLQKYFNHTEQSAIQIMLAIHHQGKGIAGIYPKDIAETKVSQVQLQATKADFPLFLQIEPQADG